MDELELAKVIRDMLEVAAQPSAERILKYLTDWNKQRPKPPASDL